MFIEGAIPYKIIERAINDSKGDVGASTFFLGKIRGDKINDSIVQCIEFTAQRDIAERIAMEIIEFCKREFGIASAEIWHSLGKIQVGEPCFLVIVQAKHRKEGFSALQYIVNEVKKSCPIFGKEFLNDGNYQWKITSE